MKTQVVTTVVDSVCGTEFCFVDFTDLSADPSDLCVDLKEFGNTLYTDRTCDQLSNTFYASARIISLKTIFQHYSDNCLKLPQASWPDTSGSDERVFQFEVQFDPNLYFQDCDEDASFYLNTSPALKVDF